MQNDECKMQNEGVAFGDYFKLFSQKIPQFCILNSAFCISGICPANCNLKFYPPLAAHRMNQNDEGVVGMATKISQLQCKEVICICSGQRLGFHVLDEAQPP